MKLSTCPSQKQVTCLNGLALPWAGYTLSQSVRRRRLSETISVAHFLPEDLG